MLVKAFRLRELLAQILPELLPESNGFGEAADTCTRAACASPNRQSETIRTFQPSSGSSNCSKINFFQALRLCGEVEILSHCAPSRVPDAPKQIGILCCIEQRSR